MVRHNSGLSILSDKTDIAAFSMTHRQKMLASKRTT